MKLNSRTVGSTLCCFVLLVSQAVFCQVKLPLLISDGMVLQRDANVKIWGWVDNPEGENLYNKGGLPASPLGMGE
jgi:sialate O-acetylesterase